MLHHHLTHQLINPLISMLTVPLQTIVKSLRQSWLSWSHTSYLQNAAGPRMPICSESDVKIDPTVSTMHRQWWLPKASPCFSNLLPFIIWIHWLVYTSSKQAVMVLMIGTCVCFHPYPSTDRAHEVWQTSFSPSEPTECKNDLIIEPHISHELIIFLSWASYILLETSPGTLAQSAWILAIHQLIRRIRPHNYPSLDRSPYFLIISFSYLCEGSLLISPQACTLILHCFFLTISACFHPMIE